jgi:hypothetical protein
LSLDAFLDNYSYFGHRVLDKQINELEGQRELLQGRNKKRPKKNQTIKESEQIEKYAREKY